MLPGLYLSFFKEEYIIVALKYQLKVQKFSLFYSAPHFRLGPPHFVWSGDGIAGSVRLLCFYSVYRNQGLKI